MFDPPKQATIIISFLRSQLQKAGFKKLIIPVSGGLDSSTVTFLAVKALGKENVFVAKLPYRELGIDGDADLVISQLKIPEANVVTVDISKIVDSLSALLGVEDKLRKGNLMARVRMTILYDQAKRLRALVCGTENRSEYLLGYFTLYGDSASDLEPIRNLYKTQVTEMAIYLGVLERIINKKPSAGLWKGQTDEKELGFTYQEADPILSLHFDKHYSWEKIEKAGHEKGLVLKVRRQVTLNQFKHKVPKACLTCN